MSTRNYMKEVYCRWLDLVRIAPNSLLERRTYAIYEKLQIREYKRSGILIFEQ